MTAPRALRVSQVAEALQVSTSTVYDRIHRGEIPARPVGRALRIPAIWLDAFLGDRPAESADVARSGSSVDAPTADGGPAEAIAS